MAKKFEYAPGLPGYGTRGVDGSTGLAGLATYFSAYDGDSDTASIRSRILANNILYPGSEKLPDYPDRVYQTGDIFIDKNAKVWKIDLALTDRYEDTGIAINTSGLFEDSNLNSAQGFDRYSNLYGTSKLLIDNVYGSGAVGNYTQTPGFIYGNLTRNYGQVKFVDLPDPSLAFYSFATYTTGESDHDAFSIVKEIGSNKFRIGNAEDSSALTLRNTELSLDFDSIYMPGMDSGTSGNVVFIDADGKLQQGSPAAGMSWSGTTTGAIGYYAGSPLTIQQSSNLLWTGSRLYVGGDVSINGGDLTFTDFGNIKALEGKLTLSIPEQDAFDRPDIRLYAGDTANYEGFDAGNIILHAGEGGDGSLGGSTISGYGGDVSILAGTSGATNALDTDDEGRSGGRMYIQSGQGGRGTTNRNLSGDPIFGGDGGWTYITGGKGGTGNSFSSAEAFGGRGGRVYIKGGDGGAGDDGVGSAGAVYIDGGTGTNPGSVLLNNNSNGAVNTGTGTFYIDGETIHSQRVIMAPGSDAAPSLIFNQFDTNTGFYYVGSDSVGLSVGNNKVRFTEGGDGFYINPRDCSIVIQPTSTGGHPDGLVIQIIGNYGGSGAGGPIDIRGGRGAGGDSGKVEIRGGTVSGDNLPGNVLIQGSERSGSGSTFSYNRGGDVYINGGPQSDDDGPTYGTLFGGAGSVYINGGDASVERGGDVVLRGGDGSINGSGVYHAGGAVVIDASNRYYDALGGSNYSGLQLRYPPVGTVTKEIGYISGFVFYDLFGIYSKTAPSDKRFKDIREDVDATKFLEGLTDVSLYEFKWNEESKPYFASDTSSYQLGLIAQDLEPIDPRLVSTMRGNNGKDFLEIDHKNLSQFVVIGMKEQQKEINELKKIVAQQQEQIDKLLNLK